MFLHEHGPPVLLQELVFANERFVVPAIVCGHRRREQLHVEIARTAFEDTRREET